MECWPNPGLSRVILVGVRSAGGRVGPPARPCLRVLRVLRGGAWWLVQGNAARMRENASAICRAQRQVWSMHR
ncbi:hypothetical protein SAMN05661093_06452 [Kibdelosporangium aridum]|uniref:Uncharacterized protein n=1 Tax=Kibdelosporangium aridum TaxID=2030 RepID=A0A1W2FFR3_KIBAR|nr:hypothetical protein SAMN05661093_06452 [Kibdelosporangium aridum]